MIDVWARDYLSPGEAVGPYSKKCLKVMITKHSAIIIHATACRKGTKSSFRECETAVFLARFHPGFIGEAEFLAQYLRWRAAFELAHGEGVAQNLQRDALIDGGALDGARQDVVEVAIRAVENSLPGLITLNVSGLDSRKL